MKELFSHWLRLQCETWMKAEAAHLFLFSYTRRPDAEPAAAPAGGPCLLSYVKTPVGPWQGVCFHFKEPGASLSPSERTEVARLREQGYLVLIVRCLEDFKLMAQTYFSEHLKSERPSYAMRSA